MTRRPPPLSTAEAYAVGACVTDRLLSRGGAGVAAGIDFDASSKRLHPGRCRFCGEPVANLLARLAEYGIGYGTYGTTYTDDARRREDEWLALPKNVRWARLREAQEAAWYEGVPL